VRCDGLQGKSTFGDEYTNELNKVVDELAVIVGYVIVQSIVNPVMAATLTIPAFPPYFSLTDLLLGGGIEMVLILLATWAAARGLLKRSAIDLLNGNQETTVKEHVWEKTELWKRMSLFSQTVVNNCINDKRCVIATLVGVLGCTMLIVTAVTLRDNVGASIVKQYEDVYSFDTLVYVDTTVKGAADNVSQALTAKGLKHAATYVEKLQVRQPNGYRAITTLYVPTDLSAFTKMYDVHASDGTKASFDGNGIWVNVAYAAHMNLGVGDTVTVTESTGQKHDFRIAGTFEYYVIRNEFVLGKDAFQKAFEREPAPNAMLVQGGEMEFDELESDLFDTKGFDMSVDDKADNYYAFDQLARLLSTEVLVYLLLSGLMAVVVLLNLDIMFVDEKKRELIILMINGFYAKDAQAYIYRDSIVLTVIGILLGVLLGSQMGSITVAALEPVMGWFVKEFSWIATLVGVVGAGVFSTAVLFYALRRIPRFDLTDINRF